MNKLLYNLKPRKQPKHRIRRKGARAQFIAQLLYPTLDFKVKKIIKPLKSIFLNSHKQ